MARTNEELIGEFKSTIWSNGSETDRLVIGTFIPRDNDNERDEVMVKCKTGTDQLVPGMPYRLFGRWENHHKYGPQFAVSNYVKAEPLSRKGIIAYLQQNVTGIGPKIAGQLYDEYGDEAVRKLRQHPKHVAGIIKGLSEKIAIEAAEHLQAIVETEETKIELTNLLAGRGFSHKLIDKCIEVWGTHAPHVIKRDPFTLLIRRFPGCGFNRGDALYKDLGLNPHRLKRQAICIWYLLKSSMDGHTWHDIHHVRVKSQGLIGGTTPNYEGALRLAVRAGMLVIKRDHNGQAWIAEAAHAKSEERVRERIATLRDLESLEWPDVTAMESLSEHQREQATKALSGPVGILVGTPGTGKTYTAAAITKAIVEQHGAWNVAIAAPTGKAGVCCTAAISQYGLEIEATTIHRLLGVQKEGYDGNGWTFIHNAANPLPYRYVIIDEVSMLDTDLAANLFDAIAPGTHVLLIGDPYQLPPVGHGAPLRDMIEAGLPCGELTEIRRNSGDGVLLCRDIKEGRQFWASRVLSHQAGRNVLHIEASKPPLALRKLEQLIQSVPGELNPIWDIQVLCAVNEKSEVSRKNLNQRLQSLLNPAGEQVQGNRYRVGDKVICLKNAMLPLLAEDGAKVDPEDFVDDLGNESDEDEVKEFVANGELGEVVHIEPKLIHVLFPQPRRRVLVPLGKPDEDTTKEEKSSFDLGYAITVHKAQGSQAPITITMAAESTVCSREWWYTALSRFSKMSIVIGGRATINRQCQKQSLKGRKTFLRELITEAKREVELV